MGFIFLFRLVINMADLTFAKDLGSRFCYLLSLNDGEGETPQKEIYNWAYRTIVAPGNNLFKQNEEHTDKISQAINFLDQIAENERQKEIRIVNTYINKLKNNSKLLNILKKNNTEFDFQEFINNLQQISSSDINNPPSTQDIEKYYKELTILINSTRNTLKRFQQRIKELLNIDSEASIYLQLQNDLQNLIFEKQEEQKNRKKLKTTEEHQKFSKLIKGYIQQYIKDKLTDNINFLYDPIGTMAGIMIDFYDYIAPFYNAIIKEEDSAKREVQIEKLWGKYIRARDRFLKKLEAQDRTMEKELDSIRNTIITTNEVRAGDKSQKTIKDLIDILSQHEINKQSGGQIESDSSQTPEITWKFSQTQNLSSFIYEIIEALRKQGYKIKGSAATDVLIIDLGKIEMNGTISTIKDEIAEKVKRIGNLQNQRNSRLGVIDESGKITDLVRLYKKSNSDLQGEIEKLINQLGGRENLTTDIFIYHESLKLYARIEDKTTKEFHGRKIAIYNALDSLYASNIPLVNKNLLYGIANNLSEGAIAHHLIDPVATYFSIFAGLLMFDDIANMAREAASQAASNLQQHDVQNIHLYLLNDIYVPGSYILKMVSNAMKDGFQNFSPKSIAYASIETGNVKSEFAKIKNSNLTLQDKWNQLADFSAAHTKVQITFLTAFFQFIEDINTYMGK